MTADLGQKTMQSSFRVKRKARKKLKSSSTKKKFANLKQTNYYIIQIHWCENLE